MRKVFQIKTLSLVAVIIGLLLLNSCKKEFVVAVQSNNEEWGIVKGGGTYAKGAEIYIEAIANTGYKFVSWQDGNTDNPRTITVKTNETYTATFAGEGGGAAVFSVSAKQKVFFSPGNLEYSTMGSHAVAGGATATGTWRFAPNQWEIIGVDNKNISSTYTGWIDLFGWGTSGYDNKYPYMTSTTHLDYGNGENDIAGTNYDWGVYNAIFNPQTNTTDAPGTWRTLTVEEWVYLLETRETSSGIRYAKSQVNGVNGLIIVPDNWNSSIYVLDNVNTTTATWMSNVVNAGNWAKIEATGCVFLPAAGFRDGTSVEDVGSYGGYWSTAFNNSYYPYYLRFDLSSFYPSYYCGRFYGQSVRLVREVK